MRLRMEIAYDGTDFYGWQAQRDHRTVQEELEEALATVTGETPRVFGSGRTDQGVHALRQIAHFDVQKKVDPRRLMRSLNAVLSPDVRITRTAVARSSFHAQFDAVAKEYRYFIWNGEVPSPFDRRYRAHVRRPLDAPAMAVAARMLEGEHDFAAFTANPNRNVETTVRSIMSLTVHSRGPLIEIRALGRGFLYKMVRSLAGFLIRVGEGAEKPASAGGILESRTRTARVPTAPPNGLFLWRVYYREPAPRRRQRT
ncbi:MAG: tRNA pseudouridine(38-40) synthase TruA [Lentisphaerae bacterium]|nr:tRNA pseudouridine(38-40) synthase TruA [Lentisphaerota bacterium]